MSLDSFTDTQVAALLMLATGAANADLQATAGEPVVKASIGAPIDIPNVGQGNLPALFIYRLDSSGKEESQYELNAYSTFAIEYWAPLCPADKMITRWPLLRAVWASVAKALQGGMHPSVSSGAYVLEQAGLRAELGPGTTASFRRGASDGGFYPFFSGRMRFYEEIATDVGVTDIEGLDLFLRMHTVTLLPGATATTPAVPTQVITLGGYPASIAMSGDLSGDVVGMSGALEGDAETTSFPES